MEAEALLKTIAHAKSACNAVRGCLRFTSRTRIHCSKTHTPLAWTFSALGAVSISQRLTPYCEQEASPLLTFAEASNNSSSILEKIDLRP